MKHTWLVNRFECDDMTNIIWGFFYIERIPCFVFRRYWYRYDGLPVRRFELGFFAIGWGQTHEWFGGNDK